MVTGTLTPVRVAPQLVPALPAAAPDEHPATAPKKIFNTAVKIPAKAFAGFSAATGSVTDIHLVRTVKITY
jgi:hypothetical protein